MVFNRQKSNIDLTPILVSFFIGAGLIFNGAEIYADPFEAERLQMVELQMKTRDINSTRVLEAMKTVRWAVIIYA